MTRDDIIRMAREARLAVQEPSWGYCEVYHFAGYEEPMMHFAALVAAAEREACAQIVEAEAMQYAEPVWAFEIVNDIRARGNQ